MQTFSYHHRKGSLLRDIEPELPLLTMAGVLLGVTTVAVYLASGV